jgi:hypothetical protein
MPRLFWPNFDFEHELAAGENWQPSRALRELNSRFAPALGALCAEDDRIVLPVNPTREKVQIGPTTVRYASKEIVRQADEFAGPQWELVPWGVTQSLQRLAEQRGWQWNQPSVDKVKHWNDRLTAFQFECQPGMNLEGSQVAESIDETLEKLPAAKWVIKARFGMSARERIPGEGPTLSDAQRGWLKRRLKEQQSVIVEPWLEAVSEVGLQFEIPREGTPRLLGVLPLLNSATGEYRGSRLFLTEAEHDRWQPAVELGMQIASSTQESGYFGPLGIDAMLYRDGDEVRLRPIMDINARWTMGRVAYEWGRRLAAGENATWLVGSAAKEVLEKPPGIGRVIQTTDGKGGTVISVLLFENSKDVS